MFVQASMRGGLGLEPHEDLETRPASSVRSIATLRPLPRAWPNALLPLPRLAQRWRCFRSSRRWALANMLRSDWRRSRNGWLRNHFREIRCV